MMLNDVKIRRKSQYHGLIFDPPAFGRGSKSSNKTWRIAEDLPQLLKKIKRLLSPDAKFVLLTCHDENFTPESLAELLRQHTPSYGKIEKGTMELQSCYSGTGSGIVTGPDTLVGNNLPLGIYARWYR